MKSGPKLAKPSFAETNCPCDKTRWPGSPSQMPHGRRRKLRRSFTKPPARLLFAPERYNGYSGTCTPERSILRPRPALSVRQAVSSRVARQASDGWFWIWSMSETQTGERLPVVFVPHGGGPWPFIDTPLGEPKELEELAAYLRSIRSVPQTPPRALLVISGHWEEPVPTVMTSPHPPMLYDYYGFPPESYRISWPAPGDPSLASHVRELLENAGFKTAEDAKRGFDHGTFVPLKLAYPQAEIPTVQLSMKRGLDPKEHIALGRALA